MVAPPSPAPSREVIAGEDGAAAGRPARHHHVTPTQHPQAASRTARSRGGVPVRADGFQVRGAAGPTCPQSGQSPCLTPHRSQQRYQLTKRTQQSHRRRRRPRTKTGAPLRGIERALFTANKRDIHKQEYHRAP